MREIGGAARGRGVHGVGEWLPSRICLNGHAADSIRAWRVAHALVRGGAQSRMRSRALGLFWQELAYEDEMAEAALGTDMLGWGGQLIAAGGMRGVGAGRWREVLGTLHVQ